MLIKFIKNETPYMAGETADFDDRAAKARIRRGVAVEVPAKSPAGYVTKPTVPAPPTVDVPNLPTDGLPTYGEQPRRRGRPRKNADT